MIRPIMRYFGSKWLAAPWIVAQFMPHTTYTETYGGSAAVLLSKAPCTLEIYNDLDDEMVTLFRVLRSRDSAAELHRLLRLTPYSRREFDIAQRQPHDSDPIESARRTLVRAHMGWGSGAITRRHVTSFRASSRSRSDLTFARRWAHIPNTLSALTNRLQGVIIECDDALRILGRNDSPTAVHYVDPPYPHSTRHDGNRYRHEMTDSDHVALADVLHRCVGQVVLSGYDCSLYADLYADWHRLQRPSFSMRGGADTRIETLWLNRPAQHTLFTW